MHISFIIVEISKIFGEIGNLVSFIIVGKHKPIRGLAGRGGQRTGVGGTGEADGKGLRRSSRDRH